MEGPKFLRVMANDEPVEIPIEEDGTVLLANVVSQFPASTGLKYRNEESHSLRAIRLNQGVLVAPDAGWGERIYLAVLPVEKKKIVKEDGTTEEVEEMDDRESKRKADDHGSTDAKKRAWLCYKCGGEGHIADMCPSADGSRNSATGPECHQCHGKGHVRQRCPNNIPAGVCFKCGVYGHSGRECPSGFEGGFHGMPRDFSGGPMQGFGSFPRPGGSFGGPTERVCFKCHQPGHQVSSCPQGAGASTSACFKCGLEGHQARNCDVCFRCKNRGHLSSQCPNL